MEALFEHIHSIHDLAFDAMRKFQNELNLPILVASPVVTVTRQLYMERNCPFQDDGTLYAFESNAILGPILENLPGFWHVWFWGGYPTQSFGRFLISCGYSYLDCGREDRYNTGKDLLRQLFDCIRSVGPKGVEWEF